MNNDAVHAPRWATAAYGDAADTSPMEMSALGEHLETCSGSRGRLFGLRSAAETMHGFAAARFVTTLVVTAVLITAAVAVLL